MESPENSAKLRRGKSSKKNLVEVETEDDEFFKKWAGIVLIGPFVPAVFALIIIVCGQLVLNTWTGTCGYALDSFISAAVAVCYLFLIVFSWVYVGDTVVLSIPALGIELTLLTPFLSLKYIVFYYFVVAVISFIVWLVGSVLLQLSVFCVSTAPVLYQFSLFLVVMYWLGFIITVLYMVKMFFGSNIAKIIKETARASTIDEVEEKLFRARFDTYDPEKDNRIANDKVPLMLEDLGVFVPAEELDTLIATLDEEETGFIEFKPLLHWFRKLNAEMDALDNANDDSEDGDNDDDRETSDMFTKRR